jgi:hypothetical protein
MATACSSPLISPRHRKSPSFHRDSLYNLGMPLHKQPLTWSRQLLQDRLKTILKSKFVDQAYVTAGMGFTAEPASEVWVA